MRMATHILLIAVTVTLISAGTGLALTPKVEIKGSFDSATAKFTGTATYEFANIPEGDLLFHLPPNWYVKRDDRTEYELRIGPAEDKTVNRSDLKTLEKPIHENIFLPQGIHVSAVSVNNVASSFKIISNPKLSPSKYCKNALLAITVLKLSVERPLIIKITFQTRFNQLPSGYQNLFWDFIPRPVGFSGGMWDRKSVLPLYIRYVAEIDVINENGITDRTIRAEYESALPYLLLDPWDYQSDQLKISFDLYFESSKIDILKRIQHVVGFLKNNQLLQSDLGELRFIIWDGQLRVSGLTIFLPRRLFRYDNLFFKQFEINILNGIIAAYVNKQFLIDTNKNPWILPAIQSEILRLFFRERFNNDTHIFPWSNWLNPEYFSDYSSRRWIENKHDKEVVAADISQDIAYYSHIYHPGYEKGFHLLWLLHDRQQDYRKRLLGHIQLFLNSRPEKGSLLSKQAFLNYFAKATESRETAEKWLSTNGNVDYAIGEVQVLLQRNRYQTIVKIENFGTLSPVLEIRFIFEDGSDTRKSVTTGAGQYQFDFEKQPTEIILDPSFNILDDDLLNNTWRFPIKTRLVWDFPAVDNWLLTISPLIGDGNTFDQNIFGLNLSYSYLNQSQLQLSIWKGSSDDLLWVSELFQTGYPFLGTKLYLEAGYLRNIALVSIGVRQETFKSLPELWTDFSIWKERLDVLEDSIFTEQQRDWVGLNLSSGFPIFQSAKSVWQSNLYSLNGKSIFQPETAYHQLRSEQFFRYELDDSDIHLGYNQGFSSGRVPLQKRYPIGGTEGLPGFPRTTDLLFLENRIFEIGTTLPGILTHTNLNLINLLWLDKVVSTVNFHFGQGITESGATEDFKDIEVSLDIIGEFINRYVVNGKFAIAQPIGHKKYKDFRIILFSNWVF
ncbi:MAG: hypothetical protein HQ517_14605 [SAR324 cluster bacterium]|nr:hypothetical protein [SAR324 cluster bacterium]